ncbi:MAG: hypothetical protein RL260_2802 [Pseudomonadota bacterium]|jgi:glycerol transport system substrate-binding protein
MVFALRPIYWMVNMSFKTKSDKAAPWAKLANEKPKGETIDYDKLLGAWKEGRVR